PPAPIPRRGRCQTRPFRNLRAACAQSRSVDCFTQCARETRRLTRTTPSTQSPSALRNDLVEEVTTGATFDLDDPGNGIETDFTLQALLDFGLRHRPGDEAAAKRAVRWMGLIECALRRRPEHFGGAVEPIELDEDGAGFLSAAPAHGGEGALDVATA